MNTVTYRTAFAPYLATQTLYQLAADEGEGYSRAAATFKSDFYMDDLITGADTFEDALALRHELRNSRAREVSSYANGHRTVKV